MARKIQRVWNEYGEMNESIRDRVSKICRGFDKVIINHMMKAIKDNPDIAARDLLDVMSREIQLHAALTMARYLSSLYEKKR